MILEAGFGAGSEAWVKVQPQLARTTRTCAYDRPGYGFSDPAPLPRDGAAIARDLDDALRGGGIAGPYIVVGHSVGGLYSRLFAARRPHEVQGLVLLDPTVEHVARAGEPDGLARMRRRLKACLQVSEMSPPPSAEETRRRGCIRASASTAEIQAALQPEKWRNQLSELDAIFGGTSQSVMRLGDLLGGIPLYVITASETADRAPLMQLYPPISVWTRQHQDLAARSGAGSQRTVMSSHLVMIDRPEVVIDAVQAMVLALRAGERPPDLPPSEAPAAPTVEGMIGGDAEGLSPSAATDLAESLRRFTLRRLSDLRLP